MYPLCRAILFDVLLVLSRDDLVLSVLFHGFLEFELLLAPLRDLLLKNLKGLVLQLLGEFVLQLDFLEEVRTP